MWFSPQPSPVGPRESWPFAELLREVRLQQRTLRARRRRTPASDRLYHDAQLQAIREALAHHPLRIDLLRLLDHLDRLSP